MAKVRFYLDTRSLTGKRPVFLKLSHEGKAWTSSKAVNFSISPYDWEHAQPKSLQAKLSYFKELLEDIIPSELLTKDSKMPSINEIKTAFLYRISTVKTKSFIDHFQDFIAYQAEEIKLKSTNKYHQALNHILAFQIHTGSEVKFSDITLDFHKDFTSYLRRHYESGLVDNTIGATMAAIKTFMAWAVRKNLTDNETWKNKKFKVFKEPADIIALTRKELQDLTLIDLPDEKLSEVRDIAVVGCCVGLRINDLITLEPIHVNLSREPHIKRQTSKTREVVTIPLPEYVAAIFRKHEGKFKYALPTVTEKRFNKDIKKILGLIGLNQEQERHRKQGSKDVKIVKKRCDHFSAHRMRATFATLMIKIMPAETVMDLGGWKDYKSFSRYIKFASEDRREAMEKTFGNIGSDSFYLSPNEVSLKVAQ